MNGDGRPIRVLHVDDDADFADLAATVLAREDDQFAVETATSADDGLDCLADDQFDCVVSDYEMPGRNGIEFLDAVRETYPDLPFILFTGKGSEEIASEAISAGVTDYLQKESGTDQFTVLANRVRNAVQGVRAQRQQKRHLDAIETAQEGIGILDEDGQFLYINQAYADIYGYDPEELEGKHWELLYREEDVDRLREKVLPEVRATGQWHGRTTGLRADGSTFVEDHVLAQTDRGDLICTVRDITDQQTLRETHELVVQASTDAFWMWDPETDETVRSDDYLTQFGYETEDPGTETDWWRERIHPDDRESVLSGLREALYDPERTYDETYRFRRADGEYGHLRSRGYVVYDENGEPVRMVGAHIDITDRKEHERQLRERTEELEELTTQLEEQYRYLFEEAPAMAVVTRREDGRPVVEDCNQLFLETLGYERQEVLGEDLTEFYSPDSEPKLLSEDGYERALAGEFVREDRTLVTADGEVVETLLRAVPRKDTGQDAAGTIGFFIDVTERKDLEREKARLEEFTSIVSHDLRNPLNVAKSYAELAHEECDSEYLENVLHAHDRMEALIEDLLALARSGRQLHGREPIDLGRLATNCWRNVVTGEAQLVTDVDRELRGDRSRVQQLLENLMRNAVDHAGEDVRVTIGETDDGFYVEDDGAGIAPEAREEIFDAGYSTAEEGTGFGLSIVEQVADAHGWDVTVTEGPDSGARFEITGVEFV